MDLSMHDLRILPVQDTAQVREVAAFAREIWEEYYVPLIGRAQVDYMLAKFQSVEAMLEQMQAGYEYFLAQCGDRIVGYFAVKPEIAVKRLFISKLYVHKSRRGSGTGRRCMEFIEQLARGRGLPLLWLTVNKGNNSVKAYERLGFRIAEEIVIDIGNGFVMDDYRMEKLLQSEAQSRGGVA
jgi:diamine N-acetyltransferase